MIHHGKGITALCCPNVNCYQRFTLDNSSPKHLDWNVDSNNTFISVHVAQEKAWIETRLPSSACNPYFALLATVASGLDGVAKNLTCPEKSYSGADVIPQSLDLALEALTADSVLEEALSPLLLKAFVSIKRDAEMVKYKELETAVDKQEKLKILENNMYLLRI